MCRGRVLLTHRGGLGAGSNGRGHFGFSHGPPNSPRQSSRGSRAGRPLLSGSGRQAPLQLSPASAFGTSNTCDHVDPPHWLCAAVGSPLQSEWRLANFCHLPRYLQRQFPRTLLQWWRAVSVGIVVEGCCGVRRVSFQAQRPRPVLSKGLPKCFLRWGPRYSRAYVAIYGASLGCSRDLPFWTAHYV